MSTSLVSVIIAVLALAFNLQPATQSRPPAPGVPGALPREIRIPGTITADQSVELYAKVSGYVGTLRVDIGGRVKKGDVLLRIDVPELADELRSAEALVAANQAKVQALTAKAKEAAAAIDTAKADVARATAEQQLRVITTRRKEELRQGSAISQQE